MLLCCPPGLVLKFKLTMRYLPRHETNFKKRDAGSFLCIHVCDAHEVDVDTRGPSLRKAASD